MYVNPSSRQLIYKEKKQAVNILIFQIDPHAKRNDQSWLRILSIGFFNSQNLTGS